MVAATRIQYRKFGREMASSRSDAATHVIKIGFDKRAAGESYPKPGKLPGFLICLDSTGGNGNRMVDFPAMLALGFDEKKIKEAKTQELKGHGLLPIELSFVLMRNAEQSEGGWLYPGTMSDSFEWWNKAGLACCGNGVDAYRKQPEGGKKKIACVPIGKTGADAETFCKESSQKLCKSHARLVLSLFTRDATGKPQPLSQSLRWNARYRLDTSSGYSPQSIYNALDAAAERLNGNIVSITGVIVFGIQNKRTGDEKVSVGKTQQITFILSEEDINKREQELWSRRITERKLILLEAPKASAEDALKAHSDEAQGEAPWPVDERGAVQTEEDAEPDEPNPFDEPAAAAEPSPETPNQSSYPGALPPDETPKTPPTEFPPNKKRMVNISIEEATIPEMQDALHALIEHRVKVSGDIYAKIAEKLLAFEIGGREFNYRSVDKFTAMAQKDGAKTTTILREICARYKDDPAFVVQRAAAKV